MRNPAIYTWAPAGLSDARIGQAAFPGAARLLTNVIHDPTTKGVMAPRAAMTKITSFAGFTSPGIVNLAYQIGPRIYGLLTTGRNAGYDEPFCYDTATSSFVTIGNVLSSNVPLTPATTGDWVPPTADLVGVYLMVTYPTAAAPNYVFWFDLTNTASPQWGAGNTSTGYLSAIGGGAVGTGAKPVSITVSPDGAFVYSCNMNDNTISQFSRNMVTGVLTALMPAVSTGLGSSPTFLAISPDGSSAYATLSSEGLLGIGTRNATTGLITPATVSVASVGANPLSCCVAPDGTSVYVANEGSNTLSQFSRNLTTGALTALSPATIATGSGPFDVIPSPDGAYVYVCNYTDGTISQFSRNLTTGVLTALTPATVATGANPYTLAISTDGTSVYACNSGSNTLSQFSRNASTGQLTALSPATVATGSGPRWVVASADGQSVYVGNYTGQNISQYTRNAGTGALTPIMPNLFSVGAAFQSLAMPPDGLSLYAAFSENNGIGMSSRTGVSAFQFTSPPTAVAQYNERAYYAVGNLTVFSDPLAPFFMTDAGQGISFGSSDSITALKGQPLTTGTQGILNALLVFKQDSIYQVTGDYSTNTLASQQLTDSLGTTAPRSVQPTPKGVFFLAPDGIRTVLLSGQISEPNPDLQYVFQNVVTPSRASACYSADVYRICVDGPLPGGTTGFSDFWFSLKYDKWTGPHTFPYNVCVPLGTSCIAASNSVPGALLQGNTFPTNSDTYTENGVALTMTLQSTPLYFDPPMQEKADVEVEAMAIPGAATTFYQMTLADVTEGKLYSATYAPYSTAFMWGTNTWGGGVWKANTYNLNLWPVYFNEPLVFDTPVLSIYGNPAVDARIGPVNLRYEALGYTGP